MNSQNHNIKKYLMLSLLLLFPINPASADDPDAVVSIDCNPKASLQIEQYWAEAADDAPYPRVVDPTDMVISIRGLMWAKESPEGTVTWEKKSARRVCHIDRTEYLLILNGYKYNDYNIQGECGAGSPTLSLTIYTNQKLIASDLVLDPNCFRAGTGAILSIRLDPKKPYAELLVREHPDGNEKKVLVPLDKAITRQIVFNAQ